MVRITFRATLGAFQEDEEVLVAGVATSEDRDEEGGHYLNLQRNAEWHRGGSDDWGEDGLYVEFDDQAYGGHELIRECRLTRSLLSIDLERPIEGLDEVEGFDVELAIDEKSFEGLRAGLKRIIEGSPARFVLM
jgi:hypothetical protein